VKSTWISLLLGLGLVGCATPPAPDVTTHRDALTGLRTDLLSDNLLEAGESPRELLWLNASRVYQSANQYDYYLEVTYMAREEVGLLEIPPGSTLTLLIDGEAVTLSGSGSVNQPKAAKSGVVQEMAIYKASKLLLQKLSIAQTVRVVVKGQNGLVERDFSAGNIGNFQRFVTRYAL